MNPWAQWLSWTPVAYCIHRYIVTVDSVHEQSSRDRAWWLLDKMSSTYSWQFHIGDLVLYRSPTDPDTILTGRIIAMAGDRVRHREVPPRCNTRINATVITSDGAQTEPQTPNTDTAAPRPPSVLLKQGMCWVERDPRFSPTDQPDSNQHGPVSLQLIHARPIWLLRPHFKSIPPHLSPLQRARVSYRGIPDTV